ncbi:MAG: hypothetical protein Q9208_007191 [Pyrenodesmia sp. 3 TL-2023]
MTRTRTFSSLLLLLLSTTPALTAPASSFDDVGFRFVAGRYGISRIEDLGLSQANHLFARQAGESCEDRCKKPCKYGKIRIRPTCFCACPPKTKEQNKLCVPDGDTSEDCPLGKQKNDKNECVDKPKEGSKEDKYKEKKAAEKKKWLDGKKERDAKKKSEAYKEKKEFEKQKYKEREQERNDKRRRTGRMGKCVLLVSIVLDIADAEKLSDDYFSEDVLTSADLDQYWVDGVPLDPAIDDTLDSDDYTGQWAKDLKLPDNLDIPDELDTRSLPAETALSQEPPHKKEKRFFGGLIAAVVNIATRIGTAAASAGSSLAAIASRGFRITKAGAQKVAKSDQLKTIGDKIAKNKNWEKCLRGEKPSK